MEIMEEILQCPPIHSLEVDRDTWESAHPKGSVVKTQSSPWRPEEGDYSSIEKLTRAYAGWDLPSVLVEKLVCPRPSSVKELLLSLIVVIGSECVDLPLLRRVCITAHAYFFHMDSVTGVGLLSVLDFLLRTASETRDSNVTAFLTQQMNSTLCVLFPLVSLTKQVASSDSVALEVSTAVSGMMNATDDIVGVDLKKLRKQVTEALRRSNPTTRRGELLKSPSTSWREKRVTTFKAVVSEEAPAKRSSGRIKGAGCLRPELLRLAVEMAVVICKNGCLPKQETQIAGPKVHMLALELLWTVLHSYQCL
ncbi:MAG: hypothetical protein KVP17_001401 [Porospora cf. gigantea B]|nr:MAG: hypothetical protein KVP17_001401 [Porospora cf. gigantea B]